ncbi:MAG: hypothetical protein JWM71_515 [Solirubrobacteraceae bacterium]|nr:hypothetical protein [Solirubrobacteraceae bacterium]
MRPLRVLLLVVAPLALASCGGGSHVPKTTATSAATTVPASARPQLRLDAVRSALRTVKSFHVSGTQIAADGTTTLDGDVTAQGSVDLTLTQKGATARIMIIGHGFYLRGARSFWISHKTPPALADKLASHWVKAPADPAISRLSQQLVPKTLAHCLTFDAGTIRNAGTRTFDGQPVWVLSSVGDQPGSAPGQLFISAQGRPLPVRVLQTGPDRPGGAHDPLCNDTSQPDTTTHSDIRLSRFDAAVSITAPKGALDLGQLAQQQQGTTAS